MLEANLDRPTFHTVPVGTSAWDLKVAMTLLQPHLLPLPISAEWLARGINPF